MPYEATHMFADGAIISGPESIVASAVSAETAMREQELDWIARLRAVGVKLAHPDDGWMDRTGHVLHPCYPQFDDNPDVGDVVALGWPNRPTRLLAVTRVERKHRFIDGSHRLVYWLDPQSVEEFC